MLLNIMGTEYVSSISKGTCTKLLRLRIRLLLRRIIRQSVRSGHEENVGPMSIPRDPHCSVIPLLNMLVLRNLLPHGKGLPHAGIKSAYDLLPHLRIGRIRTQIPKHIVRKYEVTQQILTIGIPCSTPQPS